MKRKVKFFGGMPPEYDDELVTTQEISSAPSEGDKEIRAIQDSAKSIENNLSNKLDDQFKKYMADQKVIHQQLEQKQRSVPIVPNITHNIYDTRDLYNMSHLLRRPTIHENPSLYVFSQQEREKERLESEAKKIRERENILLEKERNLLEKEKKILEEESKKPAKKAPKPRRARSPKPKK